MTPSLFNAGCFLSFVMGAVFVVVLIYARVSFVAYLCYKRRNAR